MKKTFKNMYSYGIISLLTFSYLIAGISAGLEISSYRYDLKSILTSDEWNSYEESLNGEPLTNKEDSNTLLQEIKCYRNETQAILTDDFEDKLNKIKENISTTFQDDALLEALEETDYDVFISLLSEFGNKTNYIEEMSEEHFLDLVNYHKEAEKLRDFSMKSIDDNSYFSEEFEV